MQYYSSFSLVDIDRMSMDEISLRTKAIHLKDVKDKENMAFNAYINRVAKETETRSNKMYYKYKTPLEFYDYESAKASILDDKEQIAKEKHKVDQFIENDKLYKEIFGEEY